MPFGQMTKEAGEEAAMDYVQSILEKLQGMRLTDYLDIIIVAFLIYKLMPIFRSTGTSRVAWIVAAVIVISWVSEVAQLHTLHFLLSQLLAIGLIAIVVLFQPELRRMIDHMSNIKLKHWLNIDKNQQEMLPVINHIVKACETMSKEKVGALIVIARTNRLDEYFKTGTMIDAQVSEQLIRNVFFPKASLHDGAMIVRDGRVTAAGCVLPLSESSRISADLGTRHRAAVGISEVSDSVTVVVSEETGTISVAVGGVLKRRLAPQTLEKLLKNELCPEAPQQEEKLVGKLRQTLKKLEKGDKKNEE